MWSEISTISKNKENNYAYLAKKALTVFLAPWPPYGALASSYAPYGPPPGWGYRLTTFLGCRSQRLSCRWHATVRGHRPSCGHECLFLSGTPALFSTRYLVRGSLQATQCATNLYSHLGHQPGLPLHISKPKQDNLVKRLLCMWSTQQNI
jgi:hypothetical protein